MKNISKETLEIIESRSTTDYQSQEFTRKRDNLLTKSWKDFEIKDLKPNLIPNGWDSFESYGMDGLAILEDYYNPLGRGVTPQSVSIINKRFHVLYEIEYVSGQEFDNSLLFLRKEGKSMYYRIVYPIYEEGNSKFFYHDVSEQSIDVDEVLIYAGSNNEESQKTEFNVRKIQIGIGVVFKTPLENGLTRIQTWGGNSYIKLQTKTQLPKVGKYNISIYAKCDKGFFIGGNDGREFNDIVQSGFNKIQREATNRNITINVRTGVFDKELDFVASNPQIVEGDVSNPVLTVTELEDGREHVQVYGATNDTKLVLKDGKGFVGENYRLTSTIQNKGIELTANTSIGDADIPKGDSKLDIQGDLKERDFTLELGARNA